MHYFVAEDLTDSGRTAAGGDRKELGGSKQEGRCGWVKLITVMLDLIRTKFASTKWEWYLKYIWMVDHCTCAPILLFRYLLSHTSCAYDVRQN